MKFDGSMIDHLQELSRIELTPEEREKLARQLGDIVAYVEQLQDVDTTGVEPTSAVVHEGYPELRADDVRPGLDRETILGAAPDRANHFFRVPKVVDREQP